MRTPEPARRTARRLLAAAVILLVLPGCRVPGQSPSPTPSTPGSTPRPFTVMSTDPIRVTDPAAMTDPSSAVLALNVFQRLMTADPAAAGTQAGRRAGLPVHLGDDLHLHAERGAALPQRPSADLGDVKFSIERSTRLNVAGSSASLLSSLRKIETPDDLTVRFLLSRPDTQFGWALASPAASIVDEEVYDADRVQEPEDPIIGSGPFQVTSFSPDQVQLTRYANYVGRTAGRLQDLVYRRVADSASIEDAMTKGTVDVVWRGLDAAAVTRLSQQVEQSPDKQTVSGFSRDGARRQTRPAAEVVADVARCAATRRCGRRSRRPCRGIAPRTPWCPAMCPGTSASFPLGGKVTPKVTWKNRINLTLGYDPTTPNGQDIAIQIRTRLENTGGLSVKLVPDPNADLVLLDRKAWTATALAWLQPYLDAPLATSAASVNATETQFRGTTDGAAADQLLAELQKQAAVDLVLLPMSQSDEKVYIRAGAEMSRGVVRTGLAARVLGPRQWLSWPRRPPGPGSGWDPSGSGSGSR